jgi:excinuclease ABC subunit A
VEPGHFSFNTREGQFPTCRGLGHIDLDVQYLPDIAVGCPACHGARFNDATLAVQIDGLTVADVLGLSVHDALERFAARAPVAAALRIASRLRTSQQGTLYVFDEPSTGLHPLDVATLAGVFDRLLDAGATIIVIDHDWTCSPPSTTSSTWDRAAAQTAGTSSRQGRQKTSRVTRAVQPGRGWPST